MGACVCARVSVYECVYVCVCVLVLCMCVCNGTYVPMSVVPVTSTMHASTTKSDFSCYFVFRSSLVESYKKKTKVELQRSIKSLKDDNAMFTNLNQDLRRILTGVSSVHAK